MRRLAFVIILFALVLASCMPGPSQRIVSVDPVDGAQDVQVDATIQVTFRGSVDPQAIARGFRLRDSSGNEVPGTVRYDDPTRTATFTPASYLGHGTGYTAIVDASATVKGRNDLPNRSDYSWSFTTEPERVMAVTVESHGDGQTVFGPRDIALTGTVSSGSPVETLEVRHNGVAVGGVTVEEEGGSYRFAVVLTLHDNDDNLVEVFAENRDALSGLEVLTLSYPYTRLETHQEAAVGIGGFNSAWNYYSPGTDERHFSGPLSGNPVILGETLYLPDHGNNRLLLHHGMPASDGESADEVLGQSSFTDWQPGTSEDRFHAPAGAASADGALVLADRENNRVLIWPGAPGGDDPATNVVGQSDFTGSDPACSATGLDSPAGVTISAGRLIVADTGNNRVLVWNRLPARAGEPADLVLGQSSFTDCAAQGGLASPNPTGFNEPTAVWSDGSRLLVADSGNNRVLVWQHFPNHAADEPTVVVGQSDLYSAHGGVGAAGLERPSALASNGNQLLVADTGNNRVLVWDLIPSSHGTPADIVLGHADFDCNIENSSYEYGYCDYGWEMHKQGLHRPAGLHLFEGGLLVADGANHRYLLFEALDQE